MKIEKYSELIGSKFGRLIILEIVRDPVLKLRCRCECGKESFPRPNKLLNGDTFSCGCLRKEKMRKSFFARKKDKKISEMFISDWEKK